MQRVDELLTDAGFANRLPINSNLFAGGDGNAVEEAPLGYYRFHFWKNDEQWKEHENWIANTDVSGPICISLLKDQQAFDNRTFYRMLVRSIFGTKSIVLLKDDISEMLGSGRTLSRIRIIGAGLKLFIEHERDGISALEDEFGAMSIRTTCSVISLSDELVRNLPSSRLREGSNQFGEFGLVRQGSIRAPRTDVVPMSQEAEPAPRNESLCKKFKELSRVNPFELAKSFTLVKDKELYTVLLDLERTLDPKVCHFDVVISGGSNAKKAQQEETWREFTKLLGEKLSKREFQLQSKYLAKNGRAPSATLEGERFSISKSATPASEEDKEATRQSLKKKVVEFIANERSYLNKLEMFDEYFVQRLHPTQNPNGILKPEVYKKIFEGFDRFVVLHRDILLKLTNFEEDAKPEKLEEMEKDGILSAESISEVMISLCDDRAFDIYLQIFRDFEERCTAVKEQSRKNPEFEALLEEAAGDPRSNSQLFDQSIRVIMQNITRYPYQIAEMIKTTFKDAPYLPVLRKAHDKLHESVRRLEAIQQIQFDGTHSLRLSTFVANSDPTVANSERVFLMKMAAYEVERGEANPSKRVTFYLYNDLIVAARKRKSQKGKFDSERRLSLGQFTHDFLFATPIDGTTLKRLDVVAKVKKGTSKAFSMEISPDATVLLNDHHVKYSSCIDKICGSYILVPKKQDKLGSFLEKFQSLEHQLFLTSTLLFSLLSF